MMVSVNWRNAECMPGRALMGCPYMSRWQVSRPSPAGARCSFLGARHPLVDIQICSGSSLRAAFDVLACVRLRLACSARVSSLDVLLAASGVDLACEARISVHVYGVPCG